MSCKSKNKSRRQGGAAIASGGFGCVFSPALKCAAKSGTKHISKLAGKSSSSSSSNISKLMFVRQAEEEYQEIERIYDQLKDMPGVDRFFVLKQVSMCKPARLTPDDLVGVEKCNALTKYHYTKTSINNNLGNLSLLTMPNAGMALDDLIYARKSSRTLLRLHEKLVELLFDAVLPMNQRNVFHSDLKDSNVLAKDTDTGDIELRIVDWGLSCIYKPGSHQLFPTVWRNRPLQFNVPFSVILFSDRFGQMYSEYLNQGGTKDEAELRPFLLTFLSTWMQERGEGHYKFINEIFFMLFSHQVAAKHQKQKLSQAALAKLVETEVTLNYIVEYLMDVLQHFFPLDKSTGKVTVRSYLDSCFVHQVDVWGFVSIYFCYLELLFNNYDQLSATEMQLFETLREIFVLYCFRPTHRPPHLASLRSDLNSVTQLLSNIVQEKNSPVTPPASAKAATLAAAIVTPPAPKKTPVTRLKRTAKRKRSSSSSSNPSKSSALSSATTYRKRKKLVRFKNPQFLQ